MSTSARVGKIPPCDICTFVDKKIKPVDAAYDGKTKQGPWAFMCSPHFKSHGTGLGTGRGQRLELVT